MLRFDPAKGVYVDEESDIRQEVRARWQQAFAQEGAPALDVSAPSPAGQLIDSQTAAIAAKDGQILYLAGQFNPETAAGRWQDALAKIYFLDRKIAQPTIVTCLCTGIAGTVIPKGALVKTAEGVSLEASNAGTIGQTGTANIIFQTVEKGPVEIGAATVTQIVTLVPGWDSVTNPAAGVTGRLEETQAAFEARRKASVAANAHGSAAALYGALANIPEVVALTVLENYTFNTSTQWGVAISPHSFYISIYGGDDTEIAKTIYEKKDAGAGTTGTTAVYYIDPNFGNAVYKYNIVRPLPLAFGVKVVVRSTAATPADAEALIKTAVENNFNGEGGAGRLAPASVVYASRFYPDILAILGQSLVSVEIAAPMGETPTWTDEVTVAADLIPVLDPADITVEILEAPSGS